MSQQKCAHTPTSAGADSHAEGRCVPMYSHEYKVRIIRIKLFRLIVVIRIELH